MHRGRAHNIGQVLLNALAGGARFGQQAILSGMEQKRADTQQSFLNRLREESAGREQERLVLAQKGFGLQEQRFGFEQEKFGLQQEIDPIEQAQIDANEARTALLRGQLGQLGRGDQQKIPLGSFIQSFLSGRQQIVPGTEESLFPTTAPAPVTPGTVDTLRTLIQQLQGIGGEQVFPQVDFEALKGRSEVRQSAIEWANKNVPQWTQASPADQEAFLRQVEARLQ